MRRVWTALSRLVDPLRRQPRDRRLDDEVRDHLERLTADYAACGLAPAEAALAARRAFGGVDQTKARYREQRGWPWLDALLQDLRFACRRVVRDPVFSATVVAVLAIGLGVGHLFFTLTYAHLVRGLPIAEADRVVAVSTVDARGADRGLSAGDLADLRQAQRTFEDLAAYTTTAVTLGDADGAAERVDATALSASAFAMTGVAALAGRTITTGDETPGTPPAVVLTERLWRSRYQRDAAVIGRHVKVDGAPATVVGVVSDRSGLPSAAAMFLPLATQPPASAGRDVRTLRVFGRLAPGAGLADAAADLDAIAADLARRFPATNAGTRLRLEPLNERLLGGAAARRGWRPFIVAGLVVIVVAATNAGNLLLVGAAARAREVALRTSLGASRGRILRQLLAESVVLAGLAALLGLIVSRAGVGLYRQRIPDGILPYWFDYSLNGALFAGLSVMTLAAVAVFAVWPALHASRTAVVAVLQDGGRSDTGRLAPRLGGAVLLAVQLGLATVLVAQTGVAALTGEESLPTDARLHDARVLTGAITLPASYGTLEARRAFQEQIVDRLRALPGVRGVALAASLPLDGAAERRLVVAGHERDDAVGEATVHVADVGAGYFAVLELPIVAGRDFVATDGTSADPPVIVNDSLARLHLAGVTPLGARLALRRPGDRDPATLRWHTVIGVVPEVRLRTGRPAAGPIAYLPLPASAPATATLLVRGESEGASLTGAVREALRNLDGLVPLHRVRSLAAATRDATWASRVSAQLATTVSAAALLLALSGLYAVVSHRTLLRRREIGLRMALGATLADIVRLVVGTVGGALAAGACLGVIGVAAWDRGFSPATAAGRALDPTILVAAIVTLAVTVALGCLWPAVRAARTSPAEALRRDS